MTTTGKDAPRVSYLSIWGPLCHHSRPSGWNSRMELRGGIFSGKGPWRFPARKRLLGWRCPGLRR